jgi:hypothetical protein
MSEEYPASPRTCNLSQEDRLRVPRAMSPIWVAPTVEHVYLTQDSQRTYHAELFLDGKYHAYAGDLLQSGIERKGLDL